MGIMIHSGKSDIYEWSLGFLNRIIVFALIFLHSVQPRLRFIHPGPAGLLITPECYADPLRKAFMPSRISRGVWAIPKLPGTPSKTIKRSLRRSIR